MLQRDAERYSIAHRIAGTPQAWHWFYLQGIEPSVVEILEYCVSDPDRFIDLRETEKQAA